jgi:hypothetical protein
MTGNKQASYYDLGDNTVIRNSETKASITGTIQFIEFLHKQHNAHVSLIYAGWVTNGTNLRAY